MAEHPYTDAELEARAAAMQRDVARYRHEPPSLDELDAAPLLSRWYLHSFRDRDHRQVVVAVGLAVGHPRLGHGLISTSEVMAWRHAEGDRPGWARTRGRLYRLGTPAQPPADLRPPMEINADAEVDETVFDELVAPGMRI